MKDVAVANLRPATAIGVWSIGALAVAAVALAGDRTFFRAEPTTAGRMMLVGLTLWLAIGWPMVTGDRLTRAFVVGQGTIFLFIAAGAMRDAIESVSGWVAFCGIAFGMSLGRGGRSLAWTLLISVVAGGAALMVLRTAFASRW